MANTEITDAIKANATGPKRASGDTGSVEQHSIPDQILADRYEKSNNAAAQQHCGLRFVQTIPPGAA